MINGIELPDIESLNDTSEMLKALAHPFRIAILQLLQNGRALTVSEIHKLLNIEQSVASHHLGFMKSRGIVCAKRRGKNIFYSINQEKIANIIECIQICAR